MICYSSMNRMRSVKVFHDCRFTASKLQFLLRFESGRPNRAPQMLSLARRLHHRSNPCLHQAAGATHQLRHARTAAGAASSPPIRRRRPRLASALKKADDKSEWWAVDGEMHEIGENVPLRERFVIPRDNIPNKRRKQLRDQFMRRTRLVIKESVCTHISFFFNLSPMVSILRSLCQLTWNALPFNRCKDVRCVNGNWLVEDGSRGRRHVLCNLGLQTVGPLFQHLF